MKLSSRPLLLAVAAATLAASLSACAPLILGGAAVGAIMAFDRRTSGAQLEDESIELRGASALRQTVGERGHVNITSYNRQVLLTGEVPNEQLKQAAEQAVGKVDNVKGIINEIAVMANTNLAQRSNDTFITGKVKASLVDDRTLYVGAFKVVTERGVVYLMGRVIQREAERATQIARNVGGVQRVVRIFEIITDEELRRMEPTLGRSAPAPAPARAPAPASSITPAPDSSVPAPATSATPARASSVTATPLPPASATR